MPGAPGKSIQDSSYHSMDDLDVDEKEHNAPPYVRLMDRNGYFQQSRGTMNIQRRGGSNKCNLYLNDFFHTLVHAHTVKLVPLVFGVYFAFIFIFAGMYFAVEESCHFEIHTFYDALYWSVETGMTIGYSTKDIYFNDCRIGFWMIASQTIIKVCLDSFFIGLLFSRFSRPQQRTNTIVFSDKAVVRRVRGGFYFMIRLAEMRKHQLVESHVRMYAVSRTDPRQRLIAEGPLQMSNMRISHPNDELGGMALLFLPMLTVHRIDAWSPLIPPMPRPLGGAGSLSHLPASTYRFPDVRLRQDDILQGNRNAYVCEMCGENYFTPEQLASHMNYNQVDDVQSGHILDTACAECGESFPGSELRRRHQAYSKHSGTWTAEQQKTHSGRADGKPGSHTLFNFSRVRSARSCRAEGGADAGDHKLQGGESEGRDPGANAASGLDSGTDEKNKPRVREPTGMEWVAMQTKASLQEYWARTQLEVLVFLEGIDGTTSATIQARHSYSFLEGDVVFDHRFANCVDLQPDGSFSMDFTRFHDLMPVAEDVEEVVVGSDL